MSAFIRNKIFFNPKDEIALVLFGTEETENHLADEQGGYDHIKTQTPMSLPGLDLVRFVNNSIVPSQSEDTQADFFDALVLGLDLVVKGTAGKKIKEYDVIMFTDAAMQFTEGGQMTQIINGYVDNGVALRVIGIGGEDFFEVS